MSLLPTAVRENGNAYSRLDEDEKGVRLVDTLGGKQEMICVNEPGLYELVIRSDKPVAKRFRKWITSVVLPEIRKTGSYGQRTTEPPRVSAIATPLSEIDLLDRSYDRMIDAGVDRILVESARMEAYARIYPQLRPAMEVGKSLLASTSAIEELPMSPTELGKAIAQQLNLEKIPSALKINEVLVIQGLQEVYYRKNSKGETVLYGYRLTERGKHYGQLEQTAGKNSDGVRLQVRWHRAVVDLIVEQLK